MLESFDRLVGSNNDDGVYGMYSVRLSGGVLAPRFDFFPRFASVCAAWTSAAAATASKVLLIHQTNSTQICAAKLFHRSRWWWSFEI